MLKRTLSSQVLRYVVLITCDYSSLSSSLYFPKLAHDAEGKREEGPGHLREVTFVPNRGALQQDGSWQDCAKFIVVLVFVVPSIRR